MASKQGEGSGFEGRGKFPWPTEEEGGGKGERGGAGSEACPPGFFERP